MCICFYQLGRGKTEVLLAYKYKYRTKCLKQDGKDYFVQGR